MPAVHLKGQKGSGHGCFSPRPNIQGSPNVFVNSTPVHREGDAWDSHGCGVCIPHAGSLSKGSSTVFVNGSGIARIGDPVDCGSVCAEGSSNVFAGG